MGFFGRLLVLVTAALAIGLALWVSITLFGLMLLVGGGAVLFLAGRQFLVEKGILNPQPGVRPEAAAEEITVIDADYKTIDDK